MNNFFVREEGLMPEQEEVILKAAVDKVKSKIICVQGVAGSGKTTIALKILLQVGNRNKNRSASQKQSVLFLTYNKLLADSCYQGLRNKPELEEVLARRGELQPRMINILTLQELFKFILTEDSIAQTIEDIECIGELGNIAAHRGVTDLLPSQIFALLTTFLRGKKELIWKKDSNGGFSREIVRVSDLEAIMDENERRSSHYRIFREPLKIISQQLLKTYEDWKENRLDRSDIARVFFEKISVVEQHLIKFRDIKAEDYRKLWRGKGDNQTEKILDWLISILNQYQNVSEIEETAAKFWNLFLREQHINQDQLNELHQKLFLWINQYGLRADPFWTGLISKLPNPIVIIDEVQDLSSIECENIISFWFQLARSKESRLILLGDLNQQMTPSGFEWDSLIKLIKEKRSIYESIDQKNPDEPHINDPLDWNFRTTPEIAKAVAGMLRQVSEKSLSQEDSSRLLERSIDPEKTILGDPRLSDYVEKIKNEFDETHLIPRLLIGSSETFELGLRKYLDRLLIVKENTSEDRYFSMVIITEHAKDLDSLLVEYKQKTNFPITAIEVIPVLSCKGLEFDRCVLYGISRMNQTNITIDILSRWYTSFTRARIQLLIFLTPEEKEFISQSGWTDIASSVIVENVNDPEKVAKELDQIGMTELDDRLLVEFGDRAFVEFQSNLENKKALDKSLSYFKKANRMDYFQKRANQAAALFEQERWWEKAATYYGLADNLVKEIYCIHRASLDYRLREDFENAEKLQREALEKISLFPQIRRLEKARAYLVIEKPALAFEEIQNEEEELKKLVSEEVYRLAEKNHNEAERKNYANLLEQYGYFDLAGKIYFLIKDLSSALSCACRPGAKTLASMAEDVFNASMEWVDHGKKEEAAKLAEQLKACKKFKFAAELFEKTGKPFLALEAYIDDGDYENAEIQAKKLHSIEAYKLMGAAYRQAKPNKWDLAYIYYHKTGDKNLIDQIEKDLRDNQRFLELGNAFRETGQIQELEKLAEWLSHQGEFALSARCWEKAENWRYACLTWMEARKYYKENFERLLGPDPADKNPSPKTLKRFYDHLELNRQRYEYESQTSAEEPSSYRSMGDSVRFANRIVEKLSLNSQWRQDLESLYGSLKKSNKNANADTQLKLPDKKTSLDETELRKLWKLIEKDIDKYCKNAKNIANEEFKKRGREIDGIDMMRNICRDNNSVREMVDQLSRRKDEEGKKLWVKSWRVLEMSDDQVQANIQSLDPVKNCELILHAIKENYSEDKRRRDTLKSWLRQELERAKSRKAKDLLDKHFPEYQPTALSSGSRSMRRKEKRSCQSDSFFDLLSELKGKASGKIRDEDNQEDFSRYIEKLLNQKDETDKIPKRWEKIKNSLSEVNDSDVNDLINRVEQEVTEITTGKINHVDKDTKSPLSLSGEHPLSGLPENSSSDANEENDSAPSDIQPNLPSENLSSADIETKNLSRSRRRRKLRKAELKPFSADQVKILDLHDYIVEEALNQLKQDLKIGSQTSKIRCLVVIHGYGKHASNKNKQAGILKQRVRLWIKNLEKDHRDRIYKVIYGENLKSNSPDLLPILEACQDIPGDLLRNQNEGMTVILFK